MNIELLEDVVIKATAARKMLGVTRDKMAAMLASGELPYTLEPLDKRIKRISLRDVERLRESRRLVSERRKAA